MAIMRDKFVSWQPSETKTHAVEKTMEIPLTYYYLHAGPFWVSLQTR